MPCHSSNKRALYVFEILHLDLWGPFSTPLVQGHRLFLTIVDDHNRFCCIVKLKSKSEVHLSIQNFVAFTEKQFEAKIRIIRTDSEIKFSMNQYFNSKGIIHQTTCTETPQQNGKVERKHQRLLSIARAILFQSKLPKIF